MTVPYCRICEADAIAKAAQTPDDLARGDYCPVCHQPTCQKHFLVVRFRWLDTRALDSAQVCATCKRTYAHRYWDTARREWIS